MLCILDIMSSTYRIPPITHRGRTKHITHRGRTKNTGVGPQTYRRDPRRKNISKNHLSQFKTDKRSVIIHPQYGYVAQLVRAQHS